MGQLAIRPRWVSNSSLWQLKNGITVTNFFFRVLRVKSIKKIWNASRFCVSSLRRGHANLLCIVPILVNVPPKRYNFT